MSMANNRSAAVLPPGDEAILSVVCKDVVMGRGSGTQNHCGNVTYRKLVYLNKELYVTSSKHEKLKISKAIVAAVRHYGGRFIEVDETRGNAYFEIGDERSWKKTSQALREGQAEIRAQMTAEDAAGTRQIEYQQVISEQRFFAYACKILESLYNGDSGIAACGPDCPHAKRRQTLNQLGANPMQIYYAMQSLQPHIPQPQDVLSQQQLPQDSNLQYNQHYPPRYVSDGASYFPSSSVASNQETVDLYEPLPFTSPTEKDSFEPLPFTPNRVDASMMQRGHNTAAASQFHPRTVVPATVFASNATSVDPFSRTQTVASGFQRPANISQPDESMGSVLSLRNICRDDIEMSSEEGKVLMDLLNQEVEDIIRRKSYGLIKIDTTHAFEDLVFNDDIDDIPLQKLEEDVPVDDIRKTSSSTTNRSSSSRISGLSLKDDLSLMNMSVLSLDDPPKEERAAQGGVDLKLSLKTDAPAPIEYLQRDSRVSFSMVNVSLMSMDNSSFSQLVSSLTDQDSSNNKERKEKGVKESSFDSPAHVISRKLGFPMRKTFIRKIGVEGLANNESGQTTDERSNSAMSDISVFRSVVEEFTNTNSADPVGVSSAQTLDSTQVNSLLNDIDGAFSG